MFLSFFNHFSASQSLLSSLRSAGGRCAAQQFPTSAGYGADVINEAFNTYLASNSSEDKVKYDKAMLQCAGGGNASFCMAFEVVLHQTRRYIYYHNWFTKQLPRCPQERSDCSWTFDSHVFWVGFVGQNQTALLDRAEKARVRRPRAVAVVTWAYHTYPCIVK